MPVPSFFRSALEGARRGRRRDRGGHEGHAGGPCV